MQPHDVFALSGVADPRLSPDGTKVAYVVWRADRESNTYPSQIRIRDGAGDRALTEGEKTDSQPRWSPDGTRIAFTSNRGSDDKAKSQLYVVDSSGGQPTKLTDMAENVGSVQWSPDGSKILFCAREPDDAYDEEDDRDRPPRRFTRLRYRLDDVGWTLDRPQHIFTVAAEGSAPQAITKGEYDDDHPTWSPDGTRIAFAGARHETWDIEPAQDILVVDAEGGEATVVTSTDGWCEAPSWSPDGSQLAYLYTPGLFDDPRHAQIAVLDLPSGKRSLLTTSLDRNCGPFPPLRGPLWAGSDIIFAVEDRGNTHLYRAAADASGPPTPIVTGELNVTGYDVREERIVYT
ncbi:MAG: S9 family peptidase, partial [Actinobacteria bacterium]|nr:S9 family peptidase [Actinomycetota bacterium]